MTNLFVKATASAIDRHGITCTYKSITEGAYDINTSSVTNTEISYSIRSYMKHIKATQWNYPNLIGKDTGLFYILALGLGFTPSPQDLIVYDGKTYKVDNVQGHAAGGEIVLYRVLAVA